MSTDMWESFSRGPEEVFRFFGAIWNPRWPPWHLIWPDIFNFFPRTKHVQSPENVPISVMKKCCYFSEWIKSKMVVMWHVQILLWNYFMPSHQRQTLQICSSIDYMSGDQENFSHHLSSICKLFTLNRHPGNNQAISHFLANYKLLYSIAV